MGKITPRLKTLLVLVTFLGFTNFILSETNLDLRKIVQKKIFVENFEEAAPVATIEVTKTSETRKKITPLPLPGVNGIKMSAAANEQLEVTLDQITHATCDANSDGGITINVSGGTTPYTYSWNSGDTTENLTGVPAGTYSVTVTDASGETQSLTNLEVKVEDNISPNAIAQDITVQLDANGNVSITAADIDNDSNDDCGISSLSLDKDSFDCSNVGANQVTLTVTDNNDNISTATATVTVEDNITPVAIAQDITVQLDVNGNASITAADIDNGSNDACGIASFSLDKDSFDCSNVGANQVTLTVTDNNDNISTATATVTVEDNIAPVAIAQDITVQLDANGNASITAANIDNGSNDACGIASLSLDKDSFDCSNVGPNTVTLTVTDNNGNTSTENATVTVEDNIAPVVNTQNLTIQLDENGNAFIADDAVNSNSTDNCGALTFSTDITTFTCENVGDNTVTLTVTDENGNSTTGTALVTVQDDIIPVIAAVSDISTNTDEGLCSAAVAITAPSVSDNCQAPTPIGTRSDNKTLSDPFPTGETVITWTSTDANNNEAEAVSQKVTVQDNEAPVAPQLNDITWGCNYTVEVPVAMDNCDNEIEGTANRSTTFTSSGEIIWTFTDAAGNKSTASQVITINPIAISIQKQDIMCFGAANGSAEAVVTGGVAPFSYDWGTAGNTAKVENLTPGTYSVIVTDTNGCDTSAEITITEPAELQANYSSSDVTCSGNQDGTINISDATGGFGNYEYSINGTNWQQSGNFTNLNGGTYAVQIRDAQHTSCVVILESDLVIEEPQELMMTDASSTPTTCFGASDGTATAGTVSGGNGDYLYSIDNTNFGTSTTFEGLSGGTHTIFVKDSKGCSLQKTVTVAEPAVLNATVARTNVSCFEGNDGKITITNPTGGNGNFEYSVDGSNWQNSGNFTGLTSGAYNVQIRDKDAASCVITLKENYQLTHPEAPISVEVPTTRTSSYGTSTGSATANPTGGTPGYTYEWRKKGNTAILQTTKTATNLAAGFYELTVIDSKGCKLQQEVEIIDAIEAFILTRSTCEIEDDIDAIRTFHYIVEDETAVGGVGPYTYSWDFGADAINQYRDGIGEFWVEYSSIGNKIITLTVTDSTGEEYTTTQEQYIGKCYNPCGRSSNIEFDPNNIYIGYSDGTRMETSSADYCDSNVPKYIFIQVDKSANIYNPYIELGFIISNDIAEVTNHYYVSGCRSGDDIDEDQTVNQPHRVGGFIKLTIDPLIFDCGDNLNIDTFYTTWTNVSKKECGANNNKFCYSTNEPVFVPTELRAEATPTHILCKGDETGTITVRASGGFAPYSYKLSENATSQSNNLFVNLPAGDYTIYVEDAAGKKTTATATILEPETSIEATTEVTNPLCYGETGEATVTATGGTPFSTGDSYEYLWNDSNQQTTATATGLTAGNYTVTVIDANGCQILREVTITEPEQLSVAEAGDDQSFNCGFNSTILEANTPETGVGTWTIISGNGGVVADVNDPASEFTGECRYLYFTMDNRT
jgi:large repetitive protein